MPPIYHHKKSENVTGISAFLQQSKTENYLDLLVGDPLRPSGSGRSGNVPFGVEESELVAESGPGQDDLALLSTQTGHDIQERILKKNKTNSFLTKSGSNLGRSTTWFLSWDLFSNGLYYDEPYIIVLPKELEL